MRKFDALLDRLEFKYRRYAIHGLMNWIVMITAGVWVLNLIIQPMTGFSLTSFLSFSRTLILRGQIWRAVTFLFVPGYGSMLSTILSLYFYWLIGTTLESQWGKFRFNVYYLLGFLGSLIAGFITGSATTVYLNLSLFLAFAILNPDFQVLMFFILPVKMKWLAAIATAGLVVLLFTDTWAGRLALIMALINLVLFFGGRAVDMVRDYKRRREWKKNWK